MAEPALKLLGYQRRLVENPSRFTWNNWSRQTGKSTAIGLRRTIRGLERKRNQILLSAGERQSRELMIKVRQHVEALKIGFNWRESDLFEGVQFKQLEIGIPKFNIRIIGLPANPNTARGFTGDVFLDEFALHQKDREIWASVFPTVLRGEGELDIASTPKGRQNMFYRLKDNPSFDHSTVTILDAVADGLKVDPDELYRAMGDDELYRQEFLCEFVDEATAFLTYEMIGECESGSLSKDADLEALREFKGDVVAGYDIGRKKDLSVIWLFHVDGKVLRCLGMIILEQMPFREQFEIASSVLRMRCLRKMCVDATGLGMQMAEELTQYFGEYRVEGCTLTAQFKEMAASLMRNRFLDKTIVIHADDKTRNDLHSVRRIVTAAGNVRLEAPREEGSHADRFWAASLACYAASAPTGKIEVVMGPLRPSAALRNL